MPLRRSINVKSLLLLLTLLAFSNMWFFACGAGEPHSEAASPVQAEPVGQQNAADTTDEKDTGASSLEVDIIATEWEPGPPIDCEPTTLLDFTKPKECKNGREFLEGHGCIDSFVVETYSKCRVDHPKNCHRFAFMLDTGKSQLGPDPCRAAVLYKEMCDYGIGLACDDLGRLFRNGRGVAKDEERAIRLHRRACDLGYSRGCTSVGLLYRDGKLGYPKDISRYFEYQHRACDLGDKPVCTSLGNSYLDGDLGVKDEKKGLELLQNTCDKDWNLACKALKKHQNQTQ